MKNIATAIIYGKLIAIIMFVFVEMEFPHSFIPNRMYEFSRHDHLFEEMQLHNLL